MSRARRAGSSPGSAPARVAAGMVAAAAWLLAPTTLAAQAACQAPPDGIRIVGAVEAPVTVTLADMEAMDPLTVEAVGHDGEPHAYIGVTLRALLDRAGVPGGEALHGHALSGYVVVEARDGYRVTYALAELDGGYWDALPMLVFRRDGQPLDEHSGPFQIVAPDTPRHGRWARQVACLRVGYPE